MTVYRVMAERSKTCRKEHKERKRHWFSLKNAAKLDETKLTTLLTELAKQPKDQHGMGTLPKAS